MFDNICMQKGSGSRKVFHPRVGEVPFKNPVGQNMSKQFFFV